MSNLTLEGLPTEVRMMLEKAGAENFTVASRLLPARVRSHLLVTYAYARFIDDLGDLSGGDRLAELDWAAEQFARAMRGDCDIAVFREVATSARELGLSEAPYLALIEANRMDQRVTRYQDFAELETYCSLSANPVGRIVLGIFGVRDDAAEQLSDQICTGLQLVEHWQDLAEDYRAGRVYLPQEDLRRFEVAESDLGADHAKDSLRRLMAFEVHRAEQLIESGRPLLAYLPMFGRLAVSGFIGGGLAQIERIKSEGFDTLSHAVKASKSSVLSRTAKTLFGGGGTSR